MIEENETATAVTLQRGTRSVLNAVLAGRHVNIARHGTVEAVLVSRDWYAQALRAMSVCDAMAPRDGAE